MKFETTYLVKQIRSESSWHKLWELPCSMLIHYYFPDNINQLLESSFEETKINNRKSQELTIVVRLFRNVRYNTNRGNYDGTVSSNSWWSIVKVSILNRLGLFDPENEFVDSAWSFFELMVSKMAKKLPFNIFYQTW